VLTGFKLLKSSFRDSQLIRLEKVVDFSTEGGDVRDETYKLEQTAWP